MKPVVGSVVGPTSPTNWGQVLVLPGAYGVVELAFADGGARVAGVHLLTSLSRELSDIPVSLKSLEETADRGFKDGVRTVLLCVPVGQVVYLVLRGAGDIYLLRGREFAHLLHTEGAISGEVKPGDVLLLVSESFARTIREEEAQTIFDHLSPAEVAERLTLLLHEKKDGEGSAALILQLQDAAAESQPETDQSAVEIPVAKKPIFFQKFSRANAKRFITRAKENPKKVTAMILIVLFVVFGVSVLLGVVKQSGRVRDQAVLSAISDAKHALDEGVALMSLNSVKGRERLTAAKELLDQVRSRVPARSPEGIQLAGLYREITDNLTVAMQLTQVKPELFFDVGLVKKDGKASYIGFEGTTMGIVDQATKTVYALDVVSKKATILGGGQTYSGLSYVAIHGDKLYVFTDSGINMVRLSDKQTVANVVKKDEQWGTIRSLVSFGGNLYLLDTQKSRVWKYVSAETGFSELREYLNPDTLPDFGSAVTMAIDGSVWISTLNGNILKFTQGKADTFLPKGVDPAFGSTLIVYTSDQTKYIYVLDSQNKRVVVLDRDGMYLAQYVWQDQLTPTDLAVSEGERKIYLLAGGFIYSVPLK